MRVYTVSLKDTAILANLIKMKYTRHPKMTNRLFQLIRIKESTRHIWVEINRTTFEESHISRITGPDVFILDMKRAYDVFDDDEDGRLSVSELGDVLRSLNLNPTQAEIEELMEKADTDGEIII